MHRLKKKNVDCRVTISFLETNDKPIHTRTRTHTHFAEHFYSLSPPEHMWFHLQFTAHLAAYYLSLAHTDNCCYHPMGKDANTHTSIMLLAHPALITLESVSFGLVIYTQDLVMM